MSQGALYKAFVEYTPNGTWLARCALCSHFTEPRHCDRVRGPVASYGWCKLFDRKPEQDTR